MSKPINHRLFLKHFLSNESVLKAYLLAATGNLHVSEDLMQEVSSVLWEKFDLFDESRQFRAWALGIARLEILKWRKQKARGRNALSEKALQQLAETALETAKEAEGRRAYLSVCLNKLTQQTRKVIWMRYLEGMSIARVAEELRKSVGAIEMALVRARRALRDCLNRKYKSFVEMI